MTGAEHYQAAEHCMSSVEDDSPLSLALLAEAQVHATLALAAATAVMQGLEPPQRDWSAWYRAAGTTPHKDEDVTA